MKLYGTDLLRQYNKVKNLENSLTEQIKKRNQYLLNYADKKILNKVPNLMNDDNDPIKLLNQIVAIEKAYTEQAKQLDMFKNNS